MTARPMRPDAPITRTGPLSDLVTRAGRGMAGTRRSWLRHLALSIESTISQWHPRSPEYRIDVQCKALQVSGHFVRTDL
jgi:hypothetical protein